MWFWEGVLRGLFSGCDNKTIFDIAEGEMMDHIWETLFFGFFVGIYFSRVQEFVFLYHLITFVV